MTSEGKEKGFQMEADMQSRRWRCERARCVKQQTEVKHSWDEEEFLEDTGMTLAFPLFKTSHIFSNIALNTLFCNHLFTYLNLAPRPSEYSALVL